MALAPLAAPSPHDSGADPAPGVITVDACTTLGTTLVVHVSGEIDRFSAAPLGALLVSAAAEGYTGLVLDTYRVTFCDSGLLAVLRWWPRSGRRLRLVNPSRAVTRLLKAAGAPLPITVGGESTAGPCPPSSRSHPICHDSGREGFGT
ncbi:STAS domain-containing protein [Streptomyces sp. NPDC006339]|uniref:STAS domain-containing protein n=1 Tax=Streptomyces sp. NPDC006339 TaxID=3156755 RepID=UPI0033A9CF92